MESPDQMDHGSGRLACSGFSAWFSIRLSPARYVIGLTCREIRSQDGRFLATGSPASVFLGGSAARALATAKERECTGGKCSRQVTEDRMSRQRHAPDPGIRCKELRQWLMEAIRP